MKRRKPSNVDLQGIEKNKFYFSDIKQLTLYYQPKIDIKKNKIYGVEALLRWDHPQYGILPPSVFLDTIINSGAIIKVGKWVLFEACQQIKYLHQLGFKELCVSVNVSDQQLKEEDFFNTVKEVLNQTQVQPKYLHLEITERIFLNSKENIKKVMFNLKELKKLNIKILLDDFGTYYSCLHYLFTLPVDGIKIDKIFVDDLAHDNKKRIITKKIIEMANELGMEVIAEGIEKEEDLVCLKKLNCNQVQGFLFSKPIPIQHLVSLLHDFY